jgi:hypothetical protein
MEYLGARGTLIHEKNLKSKISCQTPFKNTDKPLERSVMLHVFFLSFKSTEKVIKIPSRSKKDLVPDVGTADEDEWYEVLDQAEQVHVPHEQTHVWTTGFITSQFFLTAKNQYRNFETNIPRKGIALTQPQFPHSCECK